MKIAVLFPGQGSQFIGMGQGFIDTNSEAKGIMEIADAICGAPIGRLCADGPMEELTAAANLQPAIAAVNLICWKQLEKRLGEHAVSYFAGHSLGEYSALQAAGILSVEDTIKLVAKRGALMGREGEKNPGGMRAVLGLDIEKVEELIDSVSGNGYATVANYNTAQQIVISGDMQGLDAVSEKVTEAGGKAIALNVSVANHSQCVAGAVPDFKKVIDEVTFNTPAIPVIFNVSADTEADTTAIKEMMAKQIVSRVRWYETITKMLDNEVDTFIEVGPKNVLKGMMRKIVPKGVKCATLQFDSPEGLDKCMEELGI